MGWCSAIGGRDREDFYYPPRPQKGQKTTLFPFFSLRHPSLCCIFECCKKEGFTNKRKKQRTWISKTGKRQKFFICSSKVGCFSCLKLVIISFIPELVWKSWTLEKYLRQCSRHKRLGVWRSPPRKRKWFHLGKRFISTVKLSFCNTWTLWRW